MQRHRAVVNFVKIGALKRNHELKRSNAVLSLFSAFFRQIWIQSSKRCPRTFIVTFLKMGTTNAVLHLGAYMNICLYFPCV